MLAAAFLASLIEKKIWRYSLESLIMFAAAASSLAGLYRCLGRERVKEGWRRLRMRFAKAKPAVAVPALNAR